MNNEKYNKMIQETYEAKKLALGYVLMRFDSVKVNELISDNVNYTVLDNSELRIIKNNPIKKYWCEHFISQSNKRYLTKIHPYKNTPFFNVINNANLLLINHHKNVLTSSNNYPKLLNKYYNALPRGKAFDRLMDKMEA